MPHGRASTAAAAAAAAAAHCKLGSAALWCAAKLKGSHPPPAAAVAESAATHIMMPGRPAVRTIKSELTSRCSCGATPHGARPPAGWWSGAGSAHCVASAAQLAATLLLAVVKQRVFSVCCRNTSSSRPSPSRSSPFSEGPAQRRSARLGPCTAVDRQAQRCPAPAKTAIDRLDGGGATAADGASRS